MENNYDDERANMTFALFIKIVIVCVVIFGFALGAFLIFKK